MRMLLVLLALFASSAFADCTVTFTTVGEHAASGAQLEQVTRWKKVPSEGVGVIYAAGQKVVDVASKEQDKAKKKDDAHSIDFSRQKACDGVTGAPEAVRVEGLTWNGVAKVLREGNKQSEALVKEGDANVAKGRKTGWGK